MLISFQRGHSVVNFRLFLSLNLNVTVINIHMHHQCMITAIKLVQISKSITECDVLDDIVN